MTSKKPRHLFEKFPDGKAPELVYCSGKMTASFSREFNTIAEINLEDIARRGKLTPIKVADAMINASDDGHSLVEIKTKSKPYQEGMVDPVWQNLIWDALNYRGWAYLLHRTGMLHHIYNVHRVTPNQK